MTISPTTLSDPNRAFYTRGIIQSNTYGPFVVTKNHLLSISDSSLRVLSTSSSAVDTLVQSYANRRSMPVVDTHFLSICKDAEGKFALKTFVFNKNITRNRPEIVEEQTYQVFSKFQKALVKGRTLSSATNTPFIPNFFEEP